MPRSLSVHARSKDVRSAALFAAFAVVACIAGLNIGWVNWAFFGVQVGAVERGVWAGPERTLTWSFPYRGEQRTIDVSLPESYLAAERDLDTSPVFAYGGTLREAFVRTLVEAEAGGPFVEEVALRTRALRTELGLDDDEYVEMLARAVQSVPYGTPRVRFAMPSQIVENGRGVCSDKSLMLAALLRHEGYGAGIWVLDEKRHIAAAVEGDAGGLGGSGFAFVETTVPAYVNAVSGEYLSGTDGPDLELIEVGRGRPYRADAQSARIADALVALRGEREVVRPRLLGAGAAVSAGRTAGSGMATARPSAYMSLANTPEAADRIARWIEENMDDREAVYRTLTGGGI